MHTLRDNIRINQSKKILNLALLEANLFISLALDAPMRRRAATKMQHNQITHPGQEKKMIQKEEAVLRGSTTIKG